MRINFFAVIMAILIVSSALSAQADGDSASSKNTTPHYFGVGAGYVTGFGLSYKYWPNKFGVQFNMLPIMSKKYSLFSIGLTGLYAIRSYSITRFFLYAGGNYYQEKENSYYSEQYRLGGGFGVELGNSNLTIDLRCGFHFVTGKLDNPGLFPSGECGVYYRI